MKLLLTEDVMKEHIQQFRIVIEQHALSIDDFEMNVDGETFRLLMAGEPVDLEVYCRTSQVTRTYHFDGSLSWLEQFSLDISQDCYS